MRNSQLKLSFPSGGAYYPVFPFVASSLTAPHLTSTTRAPNGGENSSANDMYVSLLDELDPFQIAAERYDFAFRCKQSRRLASHIGVIGPISRPKCLDTQ